MITAYATLKKAAAIANHDGKRLDDQRYKLIVQVCDEILAGQHHDMFPLHVWMTGSGTQFNMNVNEVISNRCCQIAGTPLGSHAPVHPNDHVNMAQSSNDSFPSAMCIAAAVNVKQRLVPAVAALRDAIDARPKRGTILSRSGHRALDVCRADCGRDLGGITHRICAARRFAASRSVREGRSFMARRDRRWRRGGGIRRLFFNSAAHAAVASRRRHVRARFAIWRRSPSWASAQRPAPWLLALPSL